MTKYRTISDGCASHLQYQSSKRFLFIFPKRWKYIWWPYYDTIWGRSLDTSGYKNYVCSYNNKFNEFKERWPNIDDYFVWAKEEQKDLEKKANDYHKKIKEKKGEIKYL